MKVMMPGIIKWKARSKSESESPLLGDLLVSVAHKVEHICSHIIPYIIHTYHTIHNINNIKFIFHRCMVDLYHFAGSILADVRTYPVQ